MIRCEFAALNGEAATKGTSSTRQDVLYVPFPWAAVARQRSSRQLRPPAEPRCPASRASVRLRRQSLSQQIADLLGIGIAEVAGKRPTIQAAAQGGES
jgi:hypothetical protein